MLVFVERTAAREPRQESFLSEVQGWAGGPRTDQRVRARGRVFSHRHDPTRVVALVPRDREEVGGFRGDSPGSPRDTLGTQVGASLWQLTRRHDRISQVGLYVPCDLQLRR